jgi:hypothetical protein
MNQQHNSLRLAAVAAAALLCLVSTPGAAQRRPRTPAPAPARRAEPPAEARAPQTRRAEPERSFEELLPAEGYGLYVELRRVGTLFEMGDLKTAMAAARLVDPDVSQLAAIADFVAANNEYLDEARVLIAGLSARPGLPQALVGLQLASPEAAAAFEPKYRAFLVEGAKTLGLTPEPPPRTPRGRAAGRQPPRARATASRVVVKRVGNWLLASDRQFNPARLRAEGGLSLAESQRFQSLRNRFASEQLFVYFDIVRTQEAWAVIRQQEMEARASAETTMTTTTAVVSGDGPAAAEPAAPNAPGGGGGATGPTPVNPPAAVATEPTPVAMEPEEMNPAERAAVEESLRAGAGAERAEGELSPDEPPPPTEEQMAVTSMDRLMRNLWGGIPRIPNAAALAAGIEGGTVVVRVAVENPGGGPVNLIPFLPNVISGPPTTTDAATVAPADGGIFVSTSLDWPRIFDALMGTAKDNADRLRTSAVVVNPEEEGPATPSSETASPSAEETLAQVEKFFGFKLREDFLPTLGSEVAISFPLDEFTRGFRMNPKPEGEKKDAAPGLLALVALNDPEKAARLLPRVLTMLGMSPLGGAGMATTERREGFEIRNLNNLSYAVINNYLVFGELASVRHAADEAAAHRTLAATPAYREATAWQAKQKLVQAYVSEGLMRHTIEESKRQAAGSTDPLVLALLTQLDATPEGASLASTTDGDLVVHEVRLPLGLIKVFGASAMIGVKEAPVISQEMSAAYLLTNIRSAQTNYRSKEGRARYGTIEELIAEGLLEESFVKQRTEYEVEMTAVGDKFEVTATPRQYGKSGRRSFFLDESGIIRAADHKGKPASAQDPPID